MTEEGYSSVIEHCPACNEALEWIDYSTGNKYLDYVIQSVSGLQDRPAFAIRHRFLVVL